jgi:hypothetical protein
MKLMMHPAGPRRCGPQSLALLTILTAAVSS